MSAKEKNTEAVETDVEEAGAESVEVELVEGTDDAVKDLESRLEAAEEEARESQDRFLRKAAEFDNFRKRSSKEKSDLRKYAVEAFAFDLLAVVDNLERAIDTSSKDGNCAEGILEGVSMTHKELLRVLEKYKIVPIESLAKTFDPTYHQAVSQEETDQYPSNTVVTELQKGYLIHDRLLRPAMVTVSKQSSINE